MGVEWLGPVVTSILRLLVITFLFVANWTAIILVLVYSKKKRGRQDVGRIVSVTILCVNVMYLVLVWMPFTITSVKHDVLGADISLFGTESSVPEAITPDIASDFVVEYIDLRSGNIISEETLTLGYAPDVIQVTDGQESQQSNVTYSDIEAFLKWNSFIQDIQTSACVYSLLLAAAARFLMSKKDVMSACRPLNVPVCVLVLVVVPSLVTIIFRYFTCTVLHYFPRIPDASLAGHTLYSLVCDINVTQNYVMVVLLESLAMMTLAAALGVVGLRLLVDEKYYLRSKDEESNDHPWHSKFKTLLSMEACTVDALLVLGCCWVWCKVIVVVTLYCLYGPHLSNLVSWLSNIVVSIPVVFLPIAVIMSYAFRDITSYIDDLYLSSVITATNKVDINEDDTSQTKYPIKSLGQEFSKEEKSLNIQVQDLTNYLMNDNGRAGKKDGPSELDNQHDSDTPKENLKFYLGKDIFKQIKSSVPRDDDKYIILDNEWPAAGCEGDDQESKA